MNCVLPMAKNVIIVLVPLSQHYKSCMKKFLSYSAITRKQTRECYYMQVMLPQSYSNIVIKSVDTDVFLLCIHCASKIPATVAFDTGIKNKRRILDMNNISEQLGRGMVRCYFGISLVHRFVTRFVRTRVKF